MKNHNQAKIYPVILSGGSGTRLWPLSRAQYPKQFLKLTSDLSLLQETVLRFKDSTQFHDPLVICNVEHRFLVAEQLQSVGMVARDIILEPEGRNTAPAIVIAALRLMAEDPDAIMLVLPSDHLINNPSALVDILGEAISAAQLGKSVTLGITATHPETGYGYIACGDKLPSYTNLFQVKAFVEKPDLKTAQGYLESKNYYWNSGMFIFNAKLCVSEMTVFHPEMVKECENALQQGIKDIDFIRLAKEPFLRCSNVSIDYALMEHSQNTVMAPLDCGWNDVGSWSALWEVCPKNEAGNVTIGDVLLEDVENSYIRTEGPLVSVVGLDNIIAVVSTDAVLILSKDKISKMKECTEKLKSLNRTELQSHKQVFRPWGSYQSIDCGPNFQVKRIIVKPGKKLSLQVHQHRSEHWVVVQGVGTVTNGSETFELNENQSTYIPAGTIHRLENMQSVDLELIEVQSGHYLGEDDIVRLEDHYGRVSEEATVGVKEYV